MRGKGSARLIRNWRAAGAVTIATAKRGRKQRDNANELLIAVVCVVMSETWSDVCAVIPSGLVRYTALLEERVLYHPEDGRCISIRNVAYLATKIYGVTF